MPNITIDERECDLDLLSQDAKQQLEMLLACENKLRKWQRDTMTIQTACNACAAQLKSLLPTPMDTALAQGETLKFS